LKPASALKLLTRKKTFPMTSQHPIQMDLVYYNGTPVLGSELAKPHFTDIGLARPSLEFCERLIKDAKKFDKPIENENQLNECLEHHKDLGTCVKTLQKLKQEEVAAWDRIITQIKTALRPIDELIEADQSLKNRMENYRAREVAGRLRAIERLEQKAAAKEAEAIYIEDPKKQRQATIAAKAYKKEAKKMQPMVLPGIDTVEELEHVIVTDRRLASKMPGDAVTVEANFLWFRSDIADKRRAGMKISTDMYKQHGIELVFKTRLRFPR
jgi:hypothetical protein